VTDHARRVNFGTWTTDERYVILSPSEDSLPPDELDVTTGEITPIEVTPGSTNLVILPDGTGGAVSTTGELLGTSKPVERPSEIVFDTSTARPFPAPPTGYAASRDVTALKYADGSISVCDDSDGPCVPVSYDGVAVGLSISADQERLYVGGTASVRVYDVQDGNLLDVSFPGYSVVGSADGKVLAVFDLTSVLLRDGETYDPLGDPIDVSGAANVALSPDGAILRVIDNVTGQLRLYDVASQAPIGPKVALGGSGPGWYSEIFAERRSFLVQRDGSIVELPLDPEWWREQACVAAGRNLTADEWATHIGGTPRATCPQYPAPA
jgi:WD40 repeat protein